MSNRQSFILKLALFATGLSGIVAEYVLATLATYFLGDSVFQWAIVVSLMMFAMGIGSRFSKQLNHSLLPKFIRIEFVLSVAVSFSPSVVYASSAYIPNVGILIYMLTAFIGFLIGMEIPLVIRINEEFETLRTNISSALENDYYGSLLGGLFFAFVGLPVLGLTYTPFLLGTVNLLVALVMLFSYREQTLTKVLHVSGLAVVAVILAGAWFSPQIIFFGEQSKYRDRIIYSQQSKYQKITITEWKNSYWLYINGNLQFSSLDEVMYHEPIVHSVMSLHAHPQKVLVFGGGDGCAVREILKYAEVDSVLIVDLDPAMTNLALENPILLAVNDSSFHNPKVRIVNSDAFVFAETQQFYADVIIVDLPDPKIIELSRLYSQEFYMLCQRMLRPHGVMITQAGSPYFATRAYLCIDKTMRSAGFSTIRLHNQILTMGEWGWIVGGKDSLSRALLQQADIRVPTQWLDKESMNMMTLFGKGFYIHSDTSDVAINTVTAPNLQRYYLQGNWDLY